jgi:hypothetical protein
LRAVLTSITLLVLLLTGCTTSPDGPAPTSADTDLSVETGSETPTPSAPASATESVPSPSPAPSFDLAVAPPPDEVTPEYVDLVVNELLRLYGELGAAVLAEEVQPVPVLPEGTTETLVQLFGGEYLARQRLELQTFAVDLEGVRGELLPPGEFRGLRFETLVVQYSQLECVVAVGRVNRDKSTPLGGPSDVLTAVSLAPVQRESPKNPTSWVVIDLLPNADSQGNPNPDERMFEATLEEYGDSLGNSCRESIE